MSNPQPAPELPAAYLLAVLEDPDRDAPRFDAAAWLEVNGQPRRAELVRVQCELTQLRGPRDAAAAADLRGLEARALDLLDAHGADWFPGGADFLGGRPWQRVGVYRRGFVETLALSAEDWARRAESLLELAPLAEVVLADAGLRLEIFRGQQWRLLASALSGRPGVAQRDFPTRSALVESVGSWWREAAEALRPEPATAGKK
jgi:uncharacterized protein (TIGR02996 family)